MKLYYKEYIGSVEYGEDGFSGHILSYQGHSVSDNRKYYGKEITELVTNFHKLIDNDYCRNCK